MFSENCHQTVVINAHLVQYVIRCILLRLWRSWPLVTSRGPVSRVSDGEAVFFS